MVYINCVSFLINLFGFEKADTFSIEQNINQYTIKYRIMSLKINIVQ